MNQSIIDEIREMEAIVGPHIRKEAERFVREMLATQLFALAVSKPVPVNEPDAKPDYEAIAKECHERAKETAPYLMKELSNG